MPGEERSKITPDKTGKGKHKVEKDKTEKLAPPSEKKKK